MVGAELIFEDKWRIHALGELNLKRMFGEKKWSDKKLWEEMGISVSGYREKKIMFMLFIFFFVHCKQDTATQ